MIIEGKDPMLGEKLGAELNHEVNATIKLVLSEMERLASMPPEEAGEPVAFNEARRTVIRKIWTLAKEAIRYGARSV